MTEKRAVKLLASRGFTLEPDPGFITGRRRLEDGSQQAIKFFTWSNPKIADEQGIPRAYVVVIPCLGGWAEDGRYRVPLVEWPSADQKPRPWNDAADEIEERFLSIFDLPYEKARAVLDSLDEDRDALHWRY